MLSEDTKLALKKAQDAMDNVTEWEALEKTLALFDRMCDSRIAIITAYRDGTVDRADADVEEVLVYGSTICLRVRGCIYTDIEPLRCRRLEPHFGYAKGEEVYDDSVVVGFSVDRARSVLYRIFVCVRRHA